MKLTPRIRRAAVTLTELLVVLVIISVLSTIALPVYINQSERARIATARQEVALLGQAQEACGISHGLYLPLQVLDDLSDPQGLMSFRADTLQNEGTGVHAIDFNVPISLLGPNSVANPLLGDLSDPRINRLVSTWEGPFINFQRFNDTDKDPTNLNRDDYPLDPWGNPYLFYSPLGVIDNIPTINADGTFSSGLFNGSLVIGSDPNRFDRWAIVSLGPNGRSDFAQIIQDDIVYLFGSVRSETSL